MKNIIEKIKNNFYLKHITKVIAVGILLLIVTMLFLRIYTSHGKAYSVPDLKGYSVDKAKELLEDRKLKFEVIDSVYVTEFEKGAIVDQIPSAEFKVKKNRTIFLTINAHTAEKVVMPDVVRYSYRQAVAVLKTKGLDVGRLIYKPDIAKNMVLQQKVNGVQVYKGDTLEKGTKIDLVIGNGLRNERVIVPDLIGLSLEKAKMKLNAAYLNLGAPIYDLCVENFEDSLRSIIYKQKPDAKKKKRLKMGSFIDVFLTTDSTKFPGYDSLMMELHKNENSLYEPE